MQIVIDITDEMWQAVQDGWVGNELWHSAIKNGTPLPKGHGRLIDAEYLKQDMIRYGWHHVDCTVSEYVEDMLPTIIEADCENCDDANKCYQELGYCNTKMERDEKAVTLTADELAQIFADMVR